MSDNTDQTDPVSRPAVGGPVEHTVGRPVEQRADRGAQCSEQGCDDCTDDDEECTYCRGSGTDRYADDLLTCPMCDGSGTA
jgi:hypothetical protein